MGTSVAAAWQKLSKVLQECSTLQPGRTEVSLKTVKALLGKLETLPPAPKAVWKRMQQLKVPLQLGAAFTAAAQDSWKSPATRAALRALQVLYNAAEQAGIITVGANGTQPNSICSSVRQQLEQSGMREQLTAVMTALAADLRAETSAAHLQAEAAVIAASGGDRDAACLDASLQSLFTAVACVHQLVLELWEPQKGFAPFSDWLCDPSAGYTVAVMQLSTAALQHMGRLAKHVRQGPHAAQHADGVRGVLLTNIVLARTLCIPMFMGMNKTQEQLEQQGQGGNRRAMQQLLLSPHMLPCMAAVLALCSSQASSTVAAASAQKADSGTQNSESKSKKNTCSSSRGQRERQQQGAPSGNTTPANSSSSSLLSSNSSSSSGDTSVAHRLQLLELLDIAPELLGPEHSGDDMMLQMLKVALQELGSVALACSFCCEARVRQFTNSGAESQQQQQQVHLEAQAEQQRWQFEQQLCLLLPTMMLQCAISLLSPSARRLLQQGTSPQNPSNPAPKTQDSACEQQQQQDVVTLDTVQWLLGLSRSATRLLYQYQHPDHTPGRLSVVHIGAWLREVLGVALQLADPLLYQQPHTSAAKATTAAKSGAAAPATGSSSGGGSSGSSGGDSKLSRSNAALPEPRLVCVEQLLELLLICREYAHVSREETLGGASSNSGSSSSGGGSGANSSSGCSSVGSSSGGSSSGSSGGGSNDNSSHEVAPAAPSVAARFVEFGAAVEAAFRAFTVAVQCGLGSTAQFSVKMSSLCSDELISRSSDNNCALMQHMDLCGPAALAKEQRQLYSLLGTVLKVGRGESAVTPLCLVEPGAGSCCLAAGQAAVRLLKVSASAGSEIVAVAAAAADQQSLSTAGAAAAAAQQLATDYLPSLVIFGRCCLQWAEQLQQQAPKLLLLSSGALKQQEQQRTEAELHAHSAALVCVPGLRSGAATQPGDLLESMAGTVSEWVGGIEAPAALAQLQAADCAPQQLQQQLQGLLSAAQETQQGLKGASLIALVRQLQITGVKFCSIAVPHFCNNPACGNISGPTEVRLVSGRSCICAGCRTARYCGRSCQRAAWKQHKPVCKALAVAAATTATAGRL